MRPPGPPPGFTGPPAPRSRRPLAALGAAALAFLLIVFLYAPIQDPDVWWHLASGARILAEGAVPRVNTFSRAAGYPWIDHQWLYQAALQNLWERAGPAGLIGLRLAAVGGCWLLLARIATPACGFLALLPFLAIGAVASNERMTDRPEVVSCFFFVLSLALLLRWRRRPGPGPLLALVALQALWANLHALAVLGVAAMAAFLAGEAVQRRVPRPAAGQPEDHGRPSLRALGLACLAGMAALAATPYGLAGALHPLELLRQLDNPAIAIAEFQGAFSGFRVTAAILAFRLLVALAALVVLLSLPRLDVPLLLLSALMLFLSASARRNIPFFVIAVLPLIGAQLPAAGARLAPLWHRLPARRALGAALSLAVIAGVLLVARDVASGRFYERDARIRRLGAGVDDTAIIRETMDYVTAEDLPEPVFNDIDSGGYFIWRAYPHRLAFIDARLEAQPPARLAAYDRAVRTAEGWDALDESARFGTVVLDHRNPVHGPLIDRLAADPAWALVHLDAEGLVFTRRSAAPAALLARDEIAPGSRIPPPYRALPTRPDRLAARIRALLAAPPAPDLRAPLGYARVLLRLGFGEQAAAAVRAALALDPRSAEALVLAGAAAEESGDREAARRRYEEALEADPSRPEAAFNLGRLALGDGDAEGALALFDRAIAARPREARAHLLRGAALLAAGRETEASAALAEARAIDPSLEDAADALRVRRGADERKPPRARGGFVRGKSDSDPPSR